MEKHCYAEDIVIEDNNSYIYNLILVQWLFFNYMLISIMYCVVFAIVQIVIFLYLDTQDLWGDKSNNNNANDNKNNDDNDNKNNNDNNNKNNKNNNDNNDNNDNNNSNKNNNDDNDNNNDKHNNYNNNNNDKNDKNNNNDNNYNSGYNEIPWKKHTYTLYHANRQYVNLRGKVWGDKLVLQTWS